MLSFSLQNLFFTHLYLPVYQNGSENEKKKKRMCTCEYKCIYVYEFIYVYVFISASVLFKIDWQAFIEIRTNVTLLENWNVIFWPPRKG